jgi:hypothetical protein
MLCHDRARRLTDLCREAERLEDAGGDIGQAVAA